MKKLPNILSIPTSTGQDIVPMAAIAVIREIDATNDVPVTYKIALINGDSYDLSEDSKTPENRRWVENANLAIYLQLHPDEAE